MPKTASALTAHFSWQTNHLVGFETEYLNNIFKVHSFSFWLPTHLSRFPCPLVYTGASNLQNLWGVCQMSICNNGIHCFLNNEREQLGDRSIFYWLQYYGFRKEGLLWVIIWLSFWILVLWSFNDYSWLNTFLILFAFHIALIAWEKVWIQLFSLQLCVNSRVDWLLNVNMATSLREEKWLIQTS